MGGEDYEHRRQRLYFESIEDADQFNAEFNHYLYSGEGIKSVMLACINSEYFEINYQTEDHRKQSHLQAAAASKNNVEIMEALIKKGADPKTDNQAITYAAWLGGVEAVECLISHGADFHHDGEKPLMMSMYVKNPTAEYLIQKGAVLEVALNTWANQNMTTVDEIIKIEKDFIEHLQNISDKLHLKDNLNEILPEKPITKAQKLSDDIESEGFSYKPPATNKSRTKL